MSQFSLPKNSKILKGEYYEDKTGSNNIKKKLMFIDGIQMMVKIQGLILLKLI